MQLFIVIFCFVDSASIRGALGEHYSCSQFLYSACGKVLLKSYQLCIKKVSITVSNSNAPCLSSGNEKSI